MTDDEIIDLARANFVSGLRLNIIDFARAIAAAEREACAKVCEDALSYNSDDPAETFAADIRARGEA